MRIFTLSALFCLLCLTTVANAQDEFVRYAAAEGEYSLLMPEAPSVSSIWANSPLPGALQIKPPVDIATIGESALYKRVDSDTGDAMTIKVDALQATADSLQNLSQDQLTQALENQVSSLSLENQKVSFSGGSKTLKWATLTGYEIGQDQRVQFHAVHYLSGLESVTLVHITFSLENRRFKSDYETLGSSIKYTGR